MSPSIVVVVADPVVNLSSALFSSPRVTFVVPFRCSPRLASVVRGINLCVCRLPNLPQLALQSELVCSPVAKQIVSVPSKGVGRSQVPSSKGP